MGDVKHTYVHPASQYDHRCPDCGCSWARSADCAVRITDVGERGFKSVAADKDGLFRCDCGNDKGFRWEGG